MRARYAVEPLGHYGLAKRYYAHFTSPIRRYADLVVHRSLFEKGKSNYSMSETAEHISTTERNSADAERDSKDVKLYAFLNAQLAAGRPHPYPALVTDLRNFGFFVDVPELAMSGLVPFSELSEDFYSFDASRQMVIGQRTRRLIKLGDRVEVQVAKVDRFKKQVDFRLAGPEKTSRASRPRSDRPPQRPFDRTFDRSIPSPQDKVVPTRVSKHPRQLRREQTTQTTPQTALGQPLARKRKQGNNWSTFQTSDSKQARIERGPESQPRPPGGRRCSSFRRNRS
jgi:ribonuclease R